VHSFAVTARRVGVDASLTAPFFASMRRDLDPRRLTADEVSDYIYGSAEVVGLMCLRAFLAGEVCDARQRARLELGARRLGAAFQKINFLRDLSTDWEGLGRDYFPGIDPNNRSDPGHLSDAAKSELVADIRVDLDAAAATIGELPRGCRTAVAAAHGLFSELTDRIAATPAPQLLRTRIRVPLTVKLRILLVARIRSWPEEAS
jgi:phytoene/squalene synthetase